MNLAQMEFTNTAQKYWTPERTEKVIGSKKYPLTPISAPYLLRTLGILNADSSISPNNMHKFIQINHMFSLIEPHISDLKQRHKSLNILDAGCGKSYLTFLFAWFFQQKTEGSDKSVQIYGVDNNKKLIQDCAAKSKLLGYDSSLHFESQSLLNLEWKQESRPHALVSLHACDTATDMALAFAIKQKSDFIAVAPCCQAELARKWKESNNPSHPFNPIFQSPQLRRETAAQLTDALRVCLLRANGYEVTCTEFVESSHTPKNRLITCIRRGNYLKTAQKEYEDLKAHLGGHAILLEELLNSPCV
jgi:hypothetical protein